jgi:hypothetical protein
MSTAKTKKTLARMAWVTALRNSGDRQCRNSYEDDGYVCALGLLAEVAGIDDVWGRTEGNVGGHAGLSQAQSLMVARLNDNGVTFSEIADVIESWFPAS